MLALQNTLQMKEATISFLDAQIEAARDNLDQLAIPYHELRVRFESAQSAYLAAKENHADLILQRTQLESSMQHLNALLHPVRRFSEDLLTRIFMFAVEAEMEKDYDRIEMPRFKRPQVVINIGRVCQKWRNAAYSKPELWTYIRLNLSHRSSVHDKLKRFLALADGLPINVFTSNLQPSFFGTSTDSEDDGNGLGAAPLLMPVKKLRSLTVNYTHYRALGYLPALGTKCLDTLEELHLRSEPLSSPASGLFSIASYLAEAPNLRILRLMHVHLLPPAAHEPSPSLQLPKVQELVMHGPVTHGTEILGFAQIISMLPNVEKITFCQNDTVPFIQNDEIYLPRLRELTTNSVALDNALRTSFGNDKIIAPKLERLFVVDQMSSTGGNGNGGTLNASIPFMTGSISSGLALFLEKVKTIKELTFVGNFDPYTNAVPFGNTSLAMQAPGIGLFGQGGMGPIIPIPAPPQLGLNGFNPIPIQQPAVTITTSGGLSLLEAMKDIERMEIQNVSSKFLQALSSLYVWEEREEPVATVSSMSKPLDEIEEVDESEEENVEASTSSILPSGSSLATSPATSNANLKPALEEERVEEREKYQSYEYFPNLRKLEITVSKTLPITAEEFETLFERRCWAEGFGKVDDTSGRKEIKRAMHMHPLEKLEVHLGAGVEDRLTDAVSRHMDLEGEEKGCRWFSWTRPDLR